MLIASSQPIYRQGLRACLEEQGRFEVVGEARTSREALSLARQAPPHVAIVETDLREVDGYETCRSLCSTALSCRVLLLGSQIDYDTVERSVFAGAMGLLHKESTPDELVCALERVSVGGYYFDQQALEIFVQCMRSRSLRAPPREKEKPLPNKALAGLTSREHEVLTLVAGGLTSREIASELQISVRTVEAHRARIGDKLKIRTVAGLVRYAVKNGILPSAR